MSLVTIQIHKISLHVCQLVYCQKEFIGKILKRWKLTFFFRSRSSIIKERNSFAFHDEGSLDRNARSHVTAKERKAASSGIGYVPVPESSITCGLEDALSLMVTVPDFGPCDCGEKVTLIAQLLPAGTPLPHVELMPN